MALGGDWTMSIKPIVDSIQADLKIAVIVIFIVHN